MRINDRYNIIATDDLNITLQRRNKKEDNSWSKYSTVGYYTSFNAALEAMVKKEIIGDGLDNFKDICNKIDELTELIKNLDIK